MRIYLSALLLLAAAGPALAQNADTDRGEELYVSAGCWQCHGFVGQGGAAGPAVAPPLAYEPFLLQLRTPRQVMIPYSEAVLSDADVQAIHDWLISLPPPADPAEIPLLQTMP